MADEQSPIIPLSRWRAALARARRNRRADALLSEPDAERLVPQLPVQELYYAIKEVGLADARELLALASPEQVQGLLDLDVWQRDRLDEARMSEWLDALVDSGPEALGAAVEALDAELVALWLQRQARVYDLTIEEPPEEPEGHFMPTPDRFFLIDVLAPGETGKALERAIDWLYRADLELARNVVMSAKWELASDLEEWSYRWRSGRMSDLGFVEFHEALSIYRYLDPASVKIGEASAPPPEPPAKVVPELPALLATNLDEAGLLARALAAIGQEPDGQAIVEQLHAALVTLFNKAMSAERVEPGDLVAARTILRLAIGYLGLGLEYLSRGDAGRAALALRTIALERIFRVGVSLTLQLGRLTHALVESGRVRAAKTTTTLLDPPYGALVDGLGRRRPLYATALDLPSSRPAGPPAEALARPRPGLPPEAHRPFASLADVARAAAALEEAAEIPKLIFDGLGVRSDAIDAELCAACAVPLEELRFGTLVRTLVANLLLSRPAALVPLAAADIPSLARLLDGAGQLPATAREQIEQALLSRLEERQYPRSTATPARLRRWLDGWLADLGTATARPDGLLVRL